ncbi:MAG: hypothetical protein AUJ85_07840 [Elusimicrobia bacterium CG1_02_37_114]|nr:MAG: hypothetical protein AUJ85_07840 [Elusimicrobia bacterium CG1_02_37_114]
MNIPKNRRLIFIVAVVIIAVLTLNSGFRNLIKYKLQHIKLTGELEQMKSENERLEKEIYYLENDKSYMEYLIRRDLGYIKPGEIEYRIISNK